MTGKSIPLVQTDNTLVTSSLNQETLHNSGNKMLEFKYVINAEHEMNQCSEARSDKYSFKLDINGSNCANKKSLSNILN